MAAALSLALSMAYAQEPVFDDNGTPMYEVNFVDTELGEFIDSVSRITGTTFIVDPRVKGKVTVRTVDLHDADAIYDIFLAQLRAQGYATVDLPNGSVKIVPDQAARLEPVPVEAGGQQGEGSDSVATRVFSVRNAASEQVLGILKPLIDPRVGVITPYPAAHQLVVTDWRSNLERIASLLRQLDRPQEAPGSGSTQVIYLRHANAGEVVKVLRGLSQEGAVPAEGAGEAEGKDRPVMPASGGPGIRLEYEEGTNAVVMVGPDSELAAYRAIVEQLDIRRAQVVVEAIIAEVSDSSAQELGVQWLFADEKFGAGIVNFGSNGVNIASIAGAAASGDNEALGDLLSTTTGATAGIGHFGGGFNFAMLVNALKGKSGFNLLSTPTLLTLDNAEASILVGQEVPFVTGSVTQNNANPYQTIERKEVGVKLRIKPQINIDNSVRLDIVQEVSSIADTSSASDVITNKREIKTKVMVEDNGLVILGGLISDELSTSDQRVPLLGDIPYLGRLFRSDATRNTKQNLMVFIRPRILRDGPSLAGLSEDKYRTLQQTTPLQLPDLAEGTRLLQVFPASRARLEGGDW
ncbi:MULTISPECIES: type II secretion system secretin GspD [unclassified Pseudomonas]|jgi:general secretion pathway protein D|uniref:type II secretion system secretin GspD n=1 Tax=Pseudomonas TaxID=286 RepID=UPI000CF563EB|nr:MULTISPECIES: type II secretion system secretin GspD [unclassified Pseudomonas]QNV69345.1 type II secretion system protein GspD [Pseudomonas sp. CFA]HBM64709.1 type II secretion system protein GspD [Pseudomonas sp.]HEN8706121.1 type II secretion system secretin GspD [Pseudomonas putida]MCX2816929.1 type II secretion system secretin GspD [Pseudomonas sp. DCB_E]MCX9144095.1 type II secretion system secretin GspD [Pseudomonas sp. DCB_Q]